VGGKLTYSTCSLNPVENEAVVAAALQICNGAVTLVDVPALPGARFSPGLAQWKVLKLKLKWKLKLKLKLKLNLNLILKQLC
jgi:tRNA (cytosine34-C5)-methyltransferase